MHVNMNVNTPPPTLHPTTDSKNMLLNDRTIYYACERVISMHKKDVVNVASISYACEHER